MWTFPYFTFREGEEGQLDGGMKKKKKSSRQQGTDGKTTETA